MDPAVRQLVKVKAMLKTETKISDIEKEIDKCLNLIEARENYCIKMTTECSQELKAIAEMTSSHQWDNVQKEGHMKHGYGYNPVIMTGHLEGEFLKSLVSLSRAKRVLEIGLFTGYSALAMAESLPSDGVVISLEMEPYLAKLANENFKKSAHGKKISVRIGLAKDELMRLAEEGDKFDIIFVDANKEEYINYYKIIMDNDMLSDNGMIVVDNALYRGGPYTDIGDKRGTALQTFNEVIASDKTVHHVMLPVRDGILLVRRKKDVEPESTNINGAHE